MAARKRKKKIKNLDDVKAKILKKLEVTTKATEVSSLSKTLLQIDRFIYEKESDGKIMQMASEIFRLLGERQKDIVERNSEPALKLPAGGSDE